MYSHHTLSSKNQLATGYLLDLYPGVEFAASLRLLSSSYAGAAVRVRRESDNAEQDIGFDINGDFDTASLESFCSGTNGYVRTWYDQSGNGNNLVQTVTTLQPIIHNSSTGTCTNDENGLPCIGELTSRQTFFANLTISQLDNITSCTMMFLFHRIATGDLYAVPLIRLRDGVSQFGIQGNTSEVAQSFIRHSFSAFSVTTYTSDPLTDAIYLAQLDFAAGTGDGLQNSDSIAVSYSPTVFSLGAGVYLQSEITGSANRGDTQIQEIVIWPDDSPNINNISSSVNSYYSIY